MEGRAVWMWLSARLTLLLALSLLAVGCSNGSSVVDPQSSPQISLLPTQTAAQTGADLQTLPQNSPLPTVAPTPTLMPESMQLVILHTNDNWGETEPCGWGQGATGGFRRRATYISQQREASEHVLLLDTGDALIGDGAPGNNTMGEVIVAGMNLMGYDAMALGPKELSLGATLLRQRMEEAQFSVLSANVLRADTGELVAAPYVILQHGARPVGVIGVTRQSEEDLSDFQVLEPREVLLKYLPDVAKQADTVVLLTNLEYRAALDLVRAAPGIDLVVAALPDSLPDQAVRVLETGTLAVTAEQPAPRHTGRRIGRLAVTLASDGSLGSESWTSVPMDSTIADDPEMAALLDTYR